MVHKHTVKMNVLKLWQQILPH